MKSYNFRALLFKSYFVPGTRVTDRKFRIFKGTVIQASYTGWLEIEADEPGYNTGWFYAGDFVKLEANS